MKDIQSIKTTALLHPRIALFLVLMTLLLVAGVGEVAAHNPAGHPVPGCENGADVVGHKNPTCHG
jgi:hypothetical protein